MFFLDKMFFLLYSILTSAMKISNLEDLRKETVRQRKELLLRLKENYHLAKKLGFTPGEARILSVKSKKLIIELARQKKQGKNGLTSN